MRASFSWVLVPGVVLAACESKTIVGPPVGPPAVVVTVTVNCQRAVTATITPWRQSLRQRDSVHWNLAAGDSLRITPKDSVAWPFENRHPSGTRTTPASSGAMKEPPPPTNTVFFYTIAVHCGAMNVVIDPELIIIPD